MGWAPIDPTLILHLESVQRIYTIQTNGLEHLDYWERLRRMNLYSVQRRMERYRVIYLWKITVGLVPNFGIHWTESETRGKMISIPHSKSNCSAIAKHMRDQSLVVHGGRIFNLLPHDIRSWSGTKDGFKEKLDLFLSNIPDHPKTQDLTPVPVSRLTCKNSNSLFDWILFLKISDRRPEVVRSV